MRYQPYRFPPALRAEMEPLRRLDDWHGPLALAADYAVLGASVWLFTLSPWFYPLVVLLIGSRQRALASLLHEGAHGILMRSRTGNRMLAEWLAGYPVFQEFETYRRSHVHGHHRHLGDPQRDPDMANYIRSGLYDVRDRYDFFTAHLIRTLALGNIVPYSRYLLVNRLGAMVQTPHLLARLILVQAAIAGALTATVGWWGYPLLWLVPLLTSFQVIGWLSEIAEHYDLFSEDAHGLTITRNRFPAWWERAFVGMHGDNYHQTHHLFPTVPFWNLARAHRVLMRDDGYALSNRNKGGILSAPAGRVSVIDQILGDLRRRPPAAPSAVRVAPGVGGVARDA